MTEEYEELPQDGWWPDEDHSPVCQWLRKHGRSIAQVVRQGDRGWRAFSMIELNKSGTTGRLLSDSIVPTKEEARTQCEAYANTLYPEQ